MLLITGVELLEEYIVKVNFNNANALIINLENKVNTIRFRQLKDKEVFNKVSTDGYCLHWNSLTEIAVSELFEIASSK